MLNRDHRKLIFDTIFPITSLIRAVFSGNQFGTVMPWIKIVIRPVQIKKEIYLQFSYFDKTKNITKNFTKTEAQDKLEELLDMSFKNIHIQTNTKTLNL